MIFNTYDFILLFLPITLFIYAFLGKFQLYKSSALWLTICSIFFYGFWNFSNLWIIFGSILFNYSIGVLIANPRWLTRLTILRIGIICNVLFLAYFKFNGFFVNLANHLLPFHMNEMILPLAISFFKFQQIGYLVDAYQLGQTVHSFKKYFLFVSFFPQLIAGPIIQHS